MLIAIHQCEGTYSDRWVARCEEQGIAHRIVNCFDSDIISQLADCDALLWQWLHVQPKDSIAALRVIRAAERMGLWVFPNLATCEHYDDKIGQKYLLEAIGAELAPAFVFYDEADALDWIDRASWPKVFKLSRGAGSQNVQLVRSASDARRLVRKAFGAGFQPVASILGDARNKFKRHRRKGDLLPALKRLPKTLRNLRQINRQMPRERGYAYFQEFLPGNTHDTRITVVGDRAFGYLRMVRANDFRASGSGLNVYEREKIDLKCVESAFRISSLLGTQALAFDYVYDTKGELAVVEVSYTFVADFIHNCPGYWDREMRWHEGQFWPQDLILDDVLGHVRERAGAR